MPQTTYSLMVCNGSVQTLYTYIHIILLDHISSTTYILLCHSPALLCLATVAFKALTYLLYSCDHYSALMH